MYSNGLQTNNRSSQIICTIHFSMKFWLSPDGRTRHLKYKLALDEVRTGSVRCFQSGQRSQAKTVEYLQVQSPAALEKLHDAKLAIADKLYNEEGVNSVNNTAVAHSGALLASMQLSECTCSLLRVFRHSVTSPTDQPTYNTYRNNWLAAMPPMVMRWLRV